LRKIPDSEEKANNIEDNKNEGKIVKIMRGILQNLPSKKKELQLKKAMSTFTSLRRITQSKD